ncbi:hypothetical protein NQ315_008856 [Exocentrus adspersus]|uniref:WW domain-containing protein n=1 Tax=Exocentrus adspersus TaxID=1586481 RepID=A0AAV8VDA7_9CUCU|nr:hypothetical protein NQ315_008856 [Exocentrus adspersus]
MGEKSCEWDYDDKSKSYYYYNNLTKKTQWEHPLDDIYRGLVKKVRAESQSLSLHDNREDMTYITDDILSLEEPLATLPPKKLEPIPLSARNKRDVRLSPLKLSPNASPKRDLKLFKQKSEDYSVGNKKLSLGFNSFDEDKDSSNFDKHPRSLERSSELKVAGGGSMFLKSNTKKQTEVSITSPASHGKVDSMQDLQPRSILREKPLIEQSKSMEFEKLSLYDKSEKDDEDKKSVRFNLDNNTDIGITFSDKSSSEDELATSDKNTKPEDVINVKVTPSSKGRFTVSPVVDINKSSALKLIKPNPADFIKPKLTINKGSESDDDTKSMEKVAINNIESFFDSDNSVSSPSDKISDQAKKLEDKADKKITILKQTIWEEKNEEIIKFQSDLQHSHKHELERILIEEKTKYESDIKTELENIRKEMEGRTTGALKDERQKLDSNLEKLKREQEKYFKEEENKLKEHFETRKEGLEKYYEEKLAEIEKELAEKVEKTREELIFNHNADIDQLKQNHAIIIEELKREFKLEEQNLRKSHQSQMTDLKTKMQNEIEEKNKSPCDERTYEKLRCEKRLLEDKYRCLKDKYLRLKTDVKLSIEKRNKRKEQSTTTNTTGSETEQSNSNNKERLKSSSTSRINNNSKTRKPQRSCSPVENLRRQLQKLEDLEDQFPENAQSDTYHLRYPFSDGQKFEGSSELEFFRHRIHLERDSIKRAKESLRNQKTLFQQRQKELKLKHGTMARHTLQQLCQEEKELTDMEVNLHRTRSLLGEKVIRLRHLEQSLQRANVQNDHKNDDATLSDISSHSASSGISSTEFATADNYNKGIMLANEKYQESSEIIQSLENLNSEIREIWDVLRTQQQQTNIAQVIPPLVYPDLGWPILAGAATLPAPPSIPTLADRLQNYRQHVVLANAQSTVVTHANQGATTTLVERTRNLRHWLRQTGIDDQI